MFPRSALSLAILILITSAIFVAGDSEEDSDSVPRGIYHFSDTDRDIETSFKIPDFKALDPLKVASDLMSSAMKVDTKKKTLAGIQMPFSLTGRPMSLQINGESHDAVSLVDDPKKRERKPEIRRTEQSPESRRAFLRARQVCLEQSADSCDQALDTFHRIRYGKSLLIGEQEDDDQHFRTIIENRLRQGQQSSPSTSTAAPESDPYLSSESVEDVENSEEPTAEIPKRSRFSHITLPKYHDKAHNFLRDIN